MADGCWNLLDDGPGMIRRCVDVEQFVIFFFVWSIGFFRRSKVTSRKSTSFKFVFISILNPISLKILIMSFLVLSVVGPSQIRRMMRPSSQYKPVSFLSILCPRVDNV